MGGLRNASSSGTKKRGREGGGEGQGSVSSGRESRRLRGCGRGKRGGRGRHTRVVPPDFLGMEFPARPLPPLKRSTARPGADKDMAQPLRELQCRHCGKIFSTPLAIFGHRSKTECGKVGVETTVTCHLCNLEGVPKRHAANHVQSGACAFLQLSKPETWGDGLGAPMDDTDDLLPPEDEYHGAEEDRENACYTFADDQVGPLPPPPEETCPHDAALKAAEEFQISYSETVLMKGSCRYNITDTGMQFVRNLLHNKVKGFRAEEVFTNQQSAKASWDKTRGVAVSGGDFFSPQASGAATLKISLPEAMKDMFRNTFKFSRTDVDGMDALYHNFQAALVQTLAGIDIENPNMFVLRGAKLINPTTYEREYDHPTTADAFLAAQDAIQDPSGVCLGVALYADKTTTSTIGNLEYYPVYYQVMNCTLAYYTKAISKGIVGFLPVIKAPNRSKGKTKKKTIPAALKELIYQAYQHHWRELLKHVRVVCRDGFKYQARGTKNPVRKLYPRLLMFLGDHPELQGVCGCSNSSQAVRGCRVCMVFSNLFDLVVPEPEQKTQLGDLRTIGELQDFRYAMEALAEEPGTVTARRKEFAQRSVQTTNPAFYEVKFDAPILEKMGVHGATPQDWLHWVSLGVVKDFKDALQFLINSSWRTADEYKSAVDTLNARLQNLPFFRCSRTGKRFDRFSSDVFSLNGLTGDLYSELFFQWRVALGGAGGDVLPDTVHTDLWDALKLTEEAYVALYYKHPISETDLPIILQRWIDALDALKSVFKWRRNENEDKGEDEEHNQEEEEVTDDDNNTEEEEEEEEEDEQEEEEEVVVAAAAAVTAQQLKRKKQKQRKVKQDELAPLSFRKPKVHAFNHFPMWVRLFGLPVYWSTMGQEMFHKDVVKKRTSRCNHRGPSTEAKMIADHNRRGFADLLHEAQQRMKNDGNDSNRDEEFSEDELEDGSNPTWKLSPKRGCSLDTLKGFALAEPDNPIRIRLLVHAGFCIASNLDLWHENTIPQIGEEKGLKDERDLYRWMENYMPAVVKLLRAKDFKVHTKFKFRKPGCPWRTIVASPRWYGGARYDFVELNVEEGQPRRFGHVIMFFKVTIRGVKPGPSAELDSLDIKTARGDRGVVTYTLEAALIRNIELVDARKLKKITKTPFKMIGDHVWGYSNELGYDVVELGTIKCTVNLLPHFALNEASLQSRDPAAYKAVLFDPSARAYFYLDPYDRTHS